MAPGPEVAPLGAGTGSVAQSRDADGASRRPQPAHAQKSNTSAAGVQHHQAEEQAFPALRGRCNRFRFVIYSRCPPCDPGGGARITFQRPAAESQSRSLVPSAR